LKFHVSGTDLTFIPASSVVAAVLAATSSETAFVRSESLISKKDRQITHNSMFADYLALRISSETKLTTKLSKIDNSLRYKAILDPRH